MNIRWSVGAKLATVTVVIVVAVTGLVTLEIADRERGTLQRSKESSANVTTDLLAVSLVAPVDFADQEAIDSELSHLRANRDVMWGAVFAEGATTPTAVMHRGDASHAVISPPSPTTRWTDGSLEITRPILRADGKRLGSVVIAFDLAPERAAFAESRLRLFERSLLVAAVTAALLVIASRRQIVRPLLRLRDAASRIEQGQRDVQVGLDSSDELGTLGRVFDQMSAAIVERETRLAEARNNLRELFDHMRQGILVFGPDGLIEETTSRQAAALFGDVAGRPIRDVLYPSADATGVELQAFDEWLRLAFDVGADAWNDLASLAPANVRIGDRHVNLEFQPIEKDGRIAKVMLLAIDATDVHRLEEAVRVQEQEHGRRIRAMRRLVAGGGQVFVAFLTGARERLARCQALLADDGPLESPKLEEILRHAHTIKGEASAFDLAPVVESAHAFEDELVQMRARSTEAPRLVAAADRARYLQRVDEVADALEKARELFVEASPIGPSILEQVTVHRADIDRLHALAADRGDELGAVAARLTARPFGETCAMLVEKAPTWAGTLGKSARLEVEGREELVPRALAAVLPGILGHLVRNAVVHGIEVEAERSIASKPTVGVVYARCVRRGDEIEIEVEDDGRGIDLAELERRSRGTVTDIRGLLGSSGLSSAPVTTHLAGRGVGLAAVRSSAATIGYSVSIDSEPGRGTRIVLHKAS